MCCTSPFLSRTPVRSFGDGSSRFDVPRLLFFPSLPPYRQRSVSTCCGSLRAARPCLLTAGGRCVEGAWAERCPHHALYAAPALLPFQRRWQPAAFLARRGMKEWSTASAAQARDLSILRSWLSLVQCSCFVLQCFFSSVCTRLHLVKFPSRLLCHDHGEAGF